VIKTKKIFVLLIALMLAGIFYNVFAQVNASSFQALSIKDGLSNNEIWSFCQDKYGYMWIATRDGLNRYDGYNYKIFKNDPADSTSLPSNQATWVLEDRDGVLWIGTSNGLAKYDRKTEKFKTYRFSNGSQANANFVNSIFEDSKGNFWIATTDGIVSFDRKNETFKRYELLREDNVVVESQFPTFVMLETTSGELIASSVSYGILKFDYDNNLFIQLKLKDNFQKTIYHSTVLAMMEDSEGKIWFGTLKGLYKIDIKNLTGEKVMNSLTGKEFASCGGLYETKSGKVWVGTWYNGLYEYDLSTKKTTRIPFQRRTFYYFYPDRTGILWMGCTGGFAKYNFNKVPIELYAFENNANQEKPSPISFSESYKYPNFVWVGTSKGIYAFDKSTGNITNTAPFVPKLNNRNELIIRDLIETKSGKLYLGTFNNAMYSVDLGSGKINQYKPIKYDNKSLIYTAQNTNIAGPFMEDSENRLWVGQVNGVSFLNNDGKTFTRIPSLSSRQYSNELLSFLHQLRKSRTPLLEMIGVGDFADLSKEFVLSEDSYLLVNSMGEGRIDGMYDYGMLETVEGDTLWAMDDFPATFHATGTFKNRQKMGTLKLKKGRYKLLYKSDDSHSTESYNQTPPQDSLYWGIELYTIKENEYQKYDSILNSDIEATFMIGQDVNSIFESTDKKIWVATQDGGLSIIDPKTLSIKNITEDKQSELSISSNDIRDICEDNFDNIWIATNDGLNKYNRKKNKITTYRENNGLPTNSLRALVLDNDGNLWVSGLKGISKVEISDSSKKPVFINYDPSDGLQGYSFWENAGIKDRAGKMYFAGPDGFNVFKPGVTDESLPDIVINNINVSNKSASEISSILGTDNFNSLKEIDLSYSQNDLTFEFASVHFARPDKNRLQYIMEGIDDTWHDGTKQIATYSNLDPGDYVFKVKGSNGDGFWSEPKVIKVSITPAWWANTYAYIGYGMVFIVFLYGVRKYELARRLRADEYRQSQLRAETAEAKALVADAERKMLEAENTRKTQELEEARALQLSMLPRELPQLPNLDIAVYMKTATEVGGDYYDFHVGMDGVLTVVLGDATGHGMKAGTMVTTTKSLFNVLAPNPNIVETFHEMTRCLKLMHLEKLSMCMSMLKIGRKNVQMSAAGMPPIFIYKQDERVIEEHVFKGMPLGTMQDFPYQVKESTINSGDSILMISDGFPELLNDKSEAFGYKRVRNLFEENSAKTPEEIISVLRKKGDEWTNSAEPDDDVTFVVIKVK